MKHSYLILLCLLGMSLNGLAQKSYRTKGEATLRIEDHMSKEEARQKAKELAMIRAIEARFGTYVEQQSDIEIKNGATNFHIIGNTKVRGEWVKTYSVDYKEDIREVHTKEGKSYQLWMHCTVKGRIRALPTGQPQFEAWPLNCPQKDCRSTAFYDEQDFYLHFKSPVKGNVTVFLQEGDSVYRLLPYQNMPERYIHAVPVAADKEYLFFYNHPDHDYYEDFDRYQTDELIMTTDQQKEWVNLYIIFSATDFSKPVLQKARYDEDYYGLPKSTHYEKFEDWIEENRLRDTGFIYEKIPLEIFERE
jgi:hypothetical protein